ncbi:MAG TPA: hypothetical protein VGG46_02435 [Terriglobales bacterium]|jgi:hypothetical protein
MFPDTNFEAKPQVTPSETIFSDPEFLESPFDRWLHLAEVIIEKHKNPKNPQPSSGQV